MVAASGTLSLPAAEVRYPADMNGVLVFVSKTQSTPLKLYAACAGLYSRPQLPGVHNYLLDHLASHGFTVSIDCNAINAIEECRIPEDMLFWNIFYCRVKILHRFVW